MPRIIQTLKPIDNKNKFSLVLRSMDYMEAVLEAAVHLQIPVDNEKLDEDYSQAIKGLENQLSEQGWYVETDRNCPPYDDLHMMSLMSQRNQDPYGND